ncbi:MAG: CBS domain-containing protein [Planctomycetota bacterium]
MSNVTEILEKKGCQVFTIGKETTVLDAALHMNEHKIGALVVAEFGKVIGMFTERDILQRVVSERLDPAETPVSLVMTKEVVCSTPETTIEEARHVMRSRRIRHMPVVDEENNLLGLISIGDLNAWQLDGQEQTIYSLREYLYGRV